MDSTLLSIKQPSSNSNTGVLTVLGLQLTATATSALLCFGFLNTDYQAGS